MTGFVFRRAVRENVPLLIGLAGGTGSGKTWSALTLAKGLAGDRPFAVIDTEAGRARHYADQFDFDHGDLSAPFRPDAYLAAIEAADAAGYPVIVVDSMSHEHAGDGGLLDWHEEELDRMAGGDFKRREAVTMAAWIKPKTSHKRMVQRLLQLRAHLILCFRAEEKISMERGQNGRMEIVEKRGPGGFRGWLPVTEKTLPYELTLSFLLMAESPGVPQPIKLQEQHRPFFPLDKPISEAAGRALGEWARGGATETPHRGSGDAATEASPQRGSDGEETRPAPVAATRPAPATASPGLSSPGEAAGGRTGGMPEHVPPTSDDAALGLVGDWRNELMEYMAGAKLRPIDVSGVIGAPFGMDAIEAHCRSNNIHWRALVDSAPKRGAA